jgi:hypothetical protein
MKMKRAAAAAAAVLLAASLTACEQDKKNTSSDRGQKLTEQAFTQQESAVPYPVSEMKDSLERRNLKERLLRQNDPDRVGYVYILSFGKFIGYYTIKGKVSSTQSQMTTAQLTDYACDDGLSGCQAQALEAPGDDGSYGENEQGVFFFTTEGVMVQVSTDYIYSDQPIAVGGIPELS